MKGGEVTADTAHRALRAALLPGGGTSRPALAAAAELGAELGAHPPRAGGPRPWVAVASLRGHARRAASLVLRAGWRESWAAGFTGTAYKNCDFLSLPPPFCRNIFSIRIAWMLSQRHPADAANSVRCYLCVLCLKCSSPCVIKHAHCVRRFWFVFNKCPGYTHADDLARRFGILCT